MPHRIDTKHARKNLKPRSSPYWKTIDPGFSIGYRKNKNTGTWFARRFVNGEYVIRRLGTADDNQEANGLDVLTFKQARQRASDNENSLLRKETIQKPESFTVKHAINDYLKWYKVNRKAYEQTETKCNVHIIPKLGNVPVTFLTTSQISDWVHEIASAPSLSSKGNPRPPFGELIETGEINRLGNPVKEYRAVPFEDWTEDMKRKRKSTANRVLTVLKAALNHAWRNDKVDDPAAWQKVKAFHGADAPKVKYLTEEQAGKLLEAASDDFRYMARAALLTGCRYGELCRMEVQDFHNGQVFIAKEKSDKPRHVPLSKDGVAFFKSLAKGKKPTDLLITHKDGEPWGSSHQTRPMRQACEKAGINPVGFHVLRHTYATLLLRPNGSQGVSIRYVAALIGDSVATCEKHYGHVIQDDLAKEVDRHLPSFGGVK